MSDIFIEMFSHTFILKAFVVGILVALCAALLGVVLVLKRFSMIGDGLSHVGFGSLSVALALNFSPLAVSVPVVIISAFLLLKLNSNSKIKGDSAIALISSSAIALGIAATSLTKGLNVDVYNYMFGSILSLTDVDVVISIILSIVVIFLFIIFYNKIFTVTFDENFAAATGTKTGIYNALIALLTALTVVVGMRLMGTMLISSLIIFPALTSMRLFKKFKSVVISSSVVSSVCLFLGLTCSFAFNTPVGASIVIVNLAVFLLSCILGIVLRKTGK